MKLKYWRPMISIDRLNIGFAWFGYYWVYNRPTKIICYNWRGGWFRDHGGKWHRVF